jgi:hypothetical protein
MELASCGLAEADLASYSSGIRIRAPVITGCLLPAATPLAYAQSRTSLEIAPFIGYRFGDGAMPLGDGAST